LVKLSDDTALLSLLQGNQSDHNNALMDFVRWCEDSFLDLNVSKTKEVIIDFRKHSEELCGWVCVILVGKLVSKYENVSIYFFYSLCVTVF